MSTELATRTDNATYISRYLDEVAPTTTAGRIVKFTKEGVFAAADDGTPLSEDKTFVALCDETLVGWIRFNGPGEPPERRCGLLFNGFQMPSRSELGDTDPTQWEKGLDGRPADPWLHQMCLVLQECDSGELYTFVSTSNTGRRAIANLLRTYERMRTKDEVPLVKLKISGFEHRDARVGWVKVPAFVVVGRTPRDSAPRSEPTAEELLDDAISF
jgi:hypothetical protein